MEPRAEIDCVTNLDLVGRSGIISPAVCSPGMPSTRVSCPGVRVATRIASGSARSCCNRPRSRQFEDYFARFIAAFPDVQTLAQADEQDVLRLWEGLGYYRRARALHAAARQVVTDHGGELPGDVDTLMSLPGIGRYTAGAIVSIAFDKPAPILEANTIRLFTRL